MNYWEQMKSKFGEEMGQACSEVCSEIASDDPPGETPVENILANIAVALQDRFPKQRKKCVACAYYVILDWMSHEVDNEELRNDPKWGPIIRQMKRDSLAQNIDITDDMASVVATITERISKQLCKECGVPYPPDDHQPVAWDLVEVEAAISKFVWTYLGNELGEE